MHYPISDGLGIACPTEHVHITFISICAEEGKRAGGAGERGGPAGAKGKIEGGAKGPPDKALLLHNFVAPGT